ncbi:MAG: hypothetical protein AAB512_01625 [Patescibacteria group bacterium]
MQKNKLVRLAKIKCAAIARNNLKFNNFAFIATMVISLFIYTRYYGNLSFGDEYDNFTYSWLMRSGVLPYRDFFTHHFPLLIFLGYPLELIGHTKIIYRSLVLAITFTFFSSMYFYLKGPLKCSVLIFTLFSSFAISFYSGFQFADGSFWAIILLASFFIAAGKGTYVLNRAEITILSFFIIFILLSSPMHVIAFVFLFAYRYFLIRSKTSQIAVYVGELKQVFLYSFAGLFIFFIYLVFTGSLKDFYFSTITFNNNYFYYRDHVQLINPKILDFYLHDFLSLVNHFKSVITTEGIALITFVKSLKGVLSNIDNNSYIYLNLIFRDFYNNFFSFEVLIIIFYIVGLVSLFINKYKSLALISLVFIFTTRLRIPEKIHEAPYYLLSYWLISVALVLFIRNVVKGKEVVVNVLGLLLSFASIAIFVNKNWYDFNQIAFNRFPQNNFETVKYLKETSSPSDKILVISPESSSYYWESQRYPLGYFVNYFTWYNWSDRLRSRWEHDLDSTRASYIIVSKEYWSNYARGLSQEEWINSSLKKVAESTNPTDFHTFGNTMQKKDLIYSTKSD